MRLVLAAAALTLFTSSLAAQSAPMLKRGATLKDPNSTRIGTVDRVNADGSVQIIFGSRFVTIPAARMVVADGGASTSLTKAEVARLP